MKKLLPFLIGLSLSSLSFLGHTEDLLQVYQQAQESNPDLRKSLAEKNAAHEKISESRGSLLPQLGLSGSYSASRGYRDSKGTDTDNTSGKLALTQTLFDMAKWKGLTLVQKQADIQDIAYQAQEQKLILESATAYFNVLGSLDSLTFMEAKKNAIGQQLEQMKQRFNVGLVAITDVYTAQAEFDQTLADEVTTRNTLENAIEVLRQVTGIHYSQLNSLDTKRFATQLPDDVNTLLTQAENNNLTLLSARLNQDLNREQIRLAQTGHMPTVDLNLSSGLNRNENKGTSTSSINASDGAISGTNQAGITLNLPLFSSGQTNSRVKQAQYGYIGASEMLESAHRSLVQNVRSSYNNISASISTIQAYKQTVISTESSLEATKAGYSVGTRTIVDVLNATTSLYNAKKLLSDARYTYLINQLQIKSALGTLNEQDLVVLNEALGEPVSATSTTL